MAWVRLDEEFPDHPKVVTAGPLAGWLHVCALAYCNRHLTDGFVPRAQVARLVNFDGMLVGYAGDEGDARLAHEPTAYEMAGILVDVGMWEERQGGYLIHDFLHFQPSRADVEALKKVKKDAGRIGGIKSGETRSGKQPTAPTKQTGSTSKAELKQTRSRTEAPGQAKTKPDTDTEGIYLVVNQDGVGAGAGKSERDRARDEPPDPLVERLAALWPGRARMRAESVDVVRRCRTVADEQVIDACIGAMLAVNDKPRSPRYLLVTVRNRLVDSGAYSASDPALEVLGAA